MTGPTRARNGCGGCDKRWSGANICHCKTCHETFGGLSSFDKHRAGTKDGKRRQGECTPPADVGLVLNAHGTWVAPSDGVDFAAIHWRSA